MRADRGEETRQVGPVTTPPSLLGRREGKAPAKKPEVWPVRWTENQD